MSVSALANPRFVRRTQLAPHEYRKNFRQIDADIISALTSEDADRVTPLMSKIYLRLVSAPPHYWERQGVLRFSAEWRDDRYLTAWVLLHEVLGVASATAKKALRWMHEQGIIGYFAGKNGVGIRIFLNRAAASIGCRPAEQKILTFPRTSAQQARTPAAEAAFSDSFAVVEQLEINSNPHAPNGGAEQHELAQERPSGGPVAGERVWRAAQEAEQGRERRRGREALAEEEVVARLRRELEQSLRATARQAAAQEHERTREWLESRGLPKAARVAQREAYKVLRQYGVVRAECRASAVEVGGRREERERGPLGEEEEEELAQACVALLEVKGQAIGETVWEMRVEAGGFLREEEAARIRARAEALKGSVGQ
jgi:hypothetical protein